MKAWIRNNSAEQRSSCLSVNSGYIRHPGINTLVSRSDGLANERGGGSQASFMLSSRHARSEASQRRRSRASRWKKVDRHPRCPHPRFRRCPSNGHGLPYLSRSRTLPIFQAFRISDSLHLQQSHSSVQHWSAQMRSRLLRSLLLNTFP